MEHKERKPSQIKPEAGNHLERKKKHFEVKKKEKADECVIIRFKSTYF